MGKKGRKPKVVVTFDKEARKEFLLGFRKRKLERREKVLNQLREQAKNERKAALKDMYSHNDVKKTPPKPSKDEEIRDTVKELGKSSSVKQTVESYNDTFSAKRFGTTQVVVTTVKVDSDDEHEPADNSCLHLRQKGLRLAPGKAEKMLNKLKQSKDRKKSRRKKHLMKKQKKRKKK